MRQRGVVFRERIRRRARRAGLDLTDTLVDQLHDYVELLRRWNERMNLTALDDEGESGVDRLLIEPLVASCRLPTREGRLVDIGSGGGSPAIPLKLAVPSLSMLMVEAKTRKAAFLREACRHLGLSAVQVETERYEALLARPEFHESYDVLTLRAVRTEARVLRGLQAFVKPGGLLFLFRGGVGGDISALVEPPLEWRATFPLVQSLRSRLVILEKRVVGSDEDKAKVV